MATAVDGSDFELSDSLSEQNPMHSPAQSSQLAEEEDGFSPPRSLRIYPRPQLLTLSKSPLICVPPNMPELKEWFGSENEQNLSKKDSEPTTPNSGRERRFRRDAEENDLPSRPSFRSSLTQPSQMGNFKHQSLRAEADREGQERLRNLSEKFDRDRLGLPLSTLRTKERGVAPHLASASTRIAPQAQGTIAARRAETREATTKKKVGEAGEDWRRGGAETRRPERNDRADREERERPRSRSRHRRDPSPTRREREGKEREKEREDYRRERVEKDDEEDPRRWRDDGRRDERTTTRRDRERGGNSKDKESTSGNPSRWTVVEERDSRSKRNTGRDKKTVPEEAKIDERRGDREKEKEPAWMDTYVPTSFSGGILGAKGGEGELDGIQAWKKNMKEKEQNANKLAPSPESSKPLHKPAETEEPMDEIQRFKKMMEMAQKQSPDSPMVVGPILGSADSSKPSSALDNDPVAAPRMSELASTTSGAISSSKHDSDPSRSLLSLLNSNNDPPHSPMNIDSGFPKLHSRLPLADNPIDRNNNDTTFNPPQGSRLLALGSRAPAKPTTNSHLLSSVVPNGGPTSATTTKPHLTGSSNLANPLSLMTDNSKVVPRTPSGFSPFEEQRELGDALRRPIGDRTQYTNDPNGLWPDSSPLDPSTAGHAIGKGSRFAKFFDGKGKETPVAQSIPKAPTPVGYVSSSPGPHVRPDSGFGQHLSNPNLEQPRTVDELFAKLNMNPMQGQRGVANNSTPMNHGPFGQQTQTPLHVLQQQQQQQLLQNQLHNARLEPLYESRNFMPDNMVPGLRSAPPPRNRENGGMFSADPLDDALLLNAQQQQRLPVQQRVVEQMYGGSIPAAYAQQQVARNAAGIPVQLPHFRGGPSPVSAQQSLLHGVQQQRLPPGLANLGARPPHDPAQFGIPGSLHNGLHMNGPPQQQQAYNNFHPATTGFTPQAPLRPPAHQLQANHHQLANLGHPGNLDARVSQHAQLLAMSGLGGGGGGMRNVSGGGFNHQAATSLQNPMLAMRQQAQHQQQQQPIHPQMLPHHLLPHHLQQVPPGPNSQTNTQELIALLMGTHRD